MTEKTIALPTPAQDALDAAHDEFVAAREEFFAVTESNLANVMTAKEAIAEAKRLTPWAQKQQSTKAAALRVIVRHRWEETEAYKAHAALRRAAAVEESVLSAIEEAPKHVANMKDVLAQSVAKENSQWDTERLLDEVLRLQTFGVKATYWAYVEQTIEDGMSPVDALLAIRDRARDALLNHHGFRAQSRSTSVTHNLTEDVRREATFAWLDDTDRFAR
jgi:hypothetical protein